MRSARRIGLRRSRSHVSILCVVESDAGFETLWAEAMVLVLGFCLFGQNEELVTRIVQTIDEPAGWSARVGAAPDLHQPFLHPHRHPLIEDKTFALPVLVTELLLVGGNPPVKLKDTPKTFLSEKGGSFLAADAAGAIHQHRFVLQVL